eukprot:UN01613
MHVHRQHIIILNMLFLSIQLPIFDYFGFDLGLQHNTIPYYNCMFIYSLPLIPTWLSMYHHIPPPQQHSIRCFHLLSTNFYYIHLGLYFWLHSQVFNILFIYSTFFQYLILISSLHLYYSAILLILSLFTICLCSIIFYFVFIFYILFTFSLCFKTLLITVHVYNMYTIPHIYINNKC